MPWSRGRIQGASGVGPARGLIRDFLTLTRAPKRLLSSPELNSLRQAYVDGVEASVKSRSPYGRFQVEYHKFEPGTPHYSGACVPPDVILLGPGSFQSEEDLAKTLVHETVELYHLNNGLTPAASANGAVRQAHEALTGVEGAIYDYGRHVGMYP